MNRQLRNQSAGALVKTDTRTSSQMMIASPAAWRSFVQSNWGQLKRLADQSMLDSPYQKLVMMVFTPVMPNPATKLTLLRRLLKKFRYCDALSKRMTEIYRDRNYSRTAEYLARDELSPEKLSRDEIVGLDWLIVATGGLDGSANQGMQAIQFARNLLESMREYRDYPSAVRVQAGSISAGGHVIFAGQDVNIVAEHYHGNKSALKAYLAAVRTEWDIPTTTIHPASQHHTPAALHQLYTPVDIWTDQRQLHNVGIEELNARRYQAIERDMDFVRESVFEVIAAHPLIVITGAAGTGKSSLCRYIVTALAFACDPRAERQSKVKGLEMLGPSWIHGPILPIYVSLRDFANTPELFPKSLAEGAANHLLDYVKRATGNLAPHLEAYLTQSDVPTHGSLLVLDGLDEVYEESDRIILQRIIENWADRFPNCRIIVTSRTYAYRHDSRWRLSERFASAELAPFTWKQVRTYIERWYANVAENRPSILGGRAVASRQAALMAADLNKTIRETRALWPLARQPLMLALLTLIHEDYKQLPDKRAELYEHTVELLDRWNIPSPADKLHEKLANINLDRMRAALKLIAFELHSEQRSTQRYPTIIQRARLLDKLIEQQSLGGGLGAGIEDVLEYLATRNGILVSDAPNLYRFPHLTIQEYLAACALLEFYDECKMPAGLSAPGGEGWNFPQNVVALLCHDYARWRNVVLFAGAIIAAGKWQDMRWQLIDELLPQNLDVAMSEQDLHCISVAAEIWGESWLKSRTRSQFVIESHLQRCLRQIHGDERIDAPERANNYSILAHLIRNQPARA
ncbi:MAG: NACHT domain-containing protein [Chloroflexi bacterium]|nr:NACHT domain-containing protein [Chloroflexota bacterium]